MTKTCSQLRRAKNEVFFKSHNMRIRDRAKSILPDANKETFELGFVCECSDLECFEEINLTLAEFANFRTNEKRFIVVNDHEHNDIETVVREKNGYTVVEKDILPASTDLYLQH